MKIEAGKFYRTRDGRKVGPMQPYSGGDHPWFGTIGDDASGAGVWYRGEGGQFADVGEYRLDIVAEWSEGPWSEGPVRTVTRKEIVPGTYGKVEVVCLEGEVTSAGMVFVRLRPTDGDLAFLKADELRAAAATLLELADALASQEKAV